MEGLQELDLVEAEKYGNTLIKIGKELVEAARVAASAFSSGVLFLRPNTEQNKISLEHLANIDEWNVLPLVEATHFSSNTDVSNIASPMTSSIGVTFEPGSKTCAGGSVPQTNESSVPERDKVQ